MLEISQALILSIVEGLTEFLPISSTAHLQLTSQLLSIPQTEFLKSFEIIIQLGAILAIILLYWRRFLTDSQTLKKVIVAFLPTGILGFLFYKIVKEVLLGNNFVALAALLIGGVVLILLELKFNHSKSKKQIKDLSLSQSLIIGLVQSLSMIPGVSRAGATIIGGRFLGLERSQAVEFSFLLAVPTMMAATGYDFLKNLNNFHSDQLSLLGIGLLGSFITALIVVKWFLKYVTTNSLIPFGVYRIILAIIFGIFLWS